MRGIDFKDSWAKYLFRRMGFVKRYVTTGKVDLPAGAIKEADLKFVHCIVNLVEKHNIPLRSKSIKVRVYK